MNKDIAIHNLKDLDRIFRETNTEYWLSCGTLLGLHRENDFISHDTDTDVCINIDSLDYELITALKKHDFKIHRVFGRIKDGFEIAIVREGVKTDLFFFYKNDNYWYHSVYADFTNIDTLKYDYVFEPFELKETEFMGHMFFTPKDIDSVIIQQYGKDWETPNKNWTYFSSPKNIKTTTTRVMREDSWSDFYNLK